MRNLIAVVLAAGLSIASGWTAPRKEVANQDKFNYKGIMVSYEDPISGRLIILNARGNESGHIIVDAGPNTFTVAGPQLEAIKLELQAQSLQLGVIEGNGTTGTASLAAIELEQIAQSLQLGVIEGNGTTGTASLAAIELEQLAQSLQLGVIEGNGTTQNVTASAIDAGVTAINTELDGQSLQLGVIEGNGTTGVAHLLDIKNAVEGTGASAQEVQGTAAVGAAAVGNPLYVFRDALGNVNAPLIDANRIIVGAWSSNGLDNVANNMFGWTKDESSQNAFLGVGPMWYDPVAGTWDRGRGDETNGMWANVKAMPDMSGNSIGARAVANPNAPDYFFDRYVDVAVAEQLLIAGQAGLKPRVLEWEITVIDGDASGTLHFTDTEVTGDSSNVFGHFDSTSQGGAIRPGDDWSPLLWGTANIPVYMNVDARSNTFTTVKARLVTRQE